MNPWGWWLVAAPLAAALVSWVLTCWITRRLHHHGILDHPEERRSHELPTPRGGGIGFVSVLVLFVVIWRPGDLWPLLVVPPLIIAGLGLAEDFRGVHAALRLLIQVAVCAGAILVAFGPESSGDPLMLLLAGVAIIALVWLVNLYNFMDGIDGIAGWQGLFVAAMLGLLLLDAGDPALGGAALVLAGAVAGFLPLNWPRARVFMGDVGSTTLGLLLGLIGLLAVVRGTGSPWWIPLLMAVFVVDTTATLVLRLVTGERWYTPHRRHTYQVMAARGMSHAAVVTRYMAVNLALVAPLVWWTRSSAEVQSGAAIALYLVLGIVWWVVRRS